MSNSSGERSSKKGWTRIGFGIGLPVALAGVAFYFLSFRAQAELQQELRLARRDGIPTTAAEFTATIPTAKEEENAALLYRSLHDLKKPGDNLTSLNRLLVCQPSATTRRNAEAALKGHADYLDIMDKAAALPKCWFDRDWEDGPAVLLPEYAYVKSGAKLLALRASVRMDRGDVAGALADLDTMLKVAGHLRQEGLLIGDLVAESVEAIGVFDLEYWLYEKPNQKALIDWLANFISTRKPPDIVREARDELFIYLWVADHTDTKEGRESLGLKEDDLRIVDRLRSSVTNKSQARVRIVQGTREYIAALRSNSPSRAEAAEKAMKLRDEALVAFPFGASLISDSPSPHLSHELNWHLRMLQHRCLLRALSQSPIPTKMDTSDLVSPATGVPLVYSYDGRQIRIDIRLGTAEVRTLKLPHDEVLKHP